MSNDLYNNKYILNWDMNIACIGEMNIELLRKWYRWENGDQFLDQEEDEI